MKSKPFKFVNLEESLKKVEQVKEAFGTVERLNFTLDEELAALFELARGAGHTQTQKGYCIEIGTYRGVSAMVMAQAIKESRVVQAPMFTVDSYQPGSSRFNLERHNLMPINFDLEDDRYLQQQGASKIGLARRAAYRLGLQDYLVQVLHDSVRFLQLFNLPIRFAFIDGGHDFNSCYSEAMFIKQLLMPGGAIAFHNNEMESVQTAMCHIFGEKDRFVLDGLTVFYCE